MKDHAFYSNANDNENALTTTKKSSSPVFMVNFNQTLHKTSLGKRN